MFAKSKPVDARECFFQQRAKSLNLAGASRPDQESRPFPTDLNIIDFAPHCRLYCLFVPVVLAPQSLFSAEFGDIEKMNLRSEMVQLLLPSSPHFPNTLTDRRLSP